MNREMNRRICEQWMRAGVTIVDPEHTWIHASVDLAPDVTILPGTSLEGATSVGSGATIGPDTTLVDVEVGPDATVIRTHGTLAVIGGTVPSLAQRFPGCRFAQRCDRGVRACPSLRSSRGSHSSWPVSTATRQAWAHDSPL